MSKGMPFEDMKGDYRINSSDGSGKFLFRMRSLVQHAGYSFEDQSVSWRIRGIMINGNACYSYGTIISVELTKGEKSTGYLIDVSKLSEGAITEDAILAEGEYVIIGDSQYWLYAQDGKFGYIDHSGNIIQMFDDASAFVNGKAMVVDGGKAYFIDENMEMSGEGIPAEAVAAIGEVFKVKTENGDQYYY